MSYPALSSVSLSAIVCDCLRFPRLICLCTDVLSIGRSYDTPGWNSKAWCDSFDTVKGDWMDVDIPFETLK